LRNEAGRSRVGAFAGAVAGRVVAEIAGFLRELSGEMAYYRYVDGRRRRRFPEGSIMTRREYERWRTEAREQHPEARC
jgi:uncharacterized short protein YbdD (DUF466 family)